MLRIPWTNRRTNKSIKQDLKIQTQDCLLITIQSQVLNSFGHVVRSDGSEINIIQGKVERMWKAQAQHSLHRPDKNHHTNFSVRENPE